MSDITTQILLEEFMVSITKMDLPFEDSKEVNLNRKFSSLAGKMQELVVGGEYMVKAKYKYDKTYGHQYTPIAIYALIPQTKESQLMFLRSNLVKGVRELTWSRIRDKIINNYLISDIITM